MHAKKIRPAIAFWILVSLSLLSCASTKFEGKAALTGRICDENGIGIPNFFVSIGIGENALTDISGVFVFREVSSGNYRITGGAYGWCPIDAAVNFFDKKGIVCIQAEKIEAVFPKIKSLVSSGKYEEAKKLVSMSKDYNEKNPVYLFYKNLISYCSSPSEKRKKSLISSLEEI